MPFLKRYRDTRRRRADAALLDWLAQNPESEPAEAAIGLGRSLTATHRQLIRLEREGRVESAWISGPVFNHNVYRTITR